MLATAERMPEHLPSAQRAAANVAKAQTTLTGRWRTRSRWPNTHIFCDRLREPPVGSRLRAGLRGLHRDRAGRGTERYGGADRCQQRSAGERSQRHPAWSSASSAFKFSCGQQAGRSHRRTCSSRHLASPAPFITGQVSLPKPRFRYGVRAGQREGARFRAAVTGTEPEPVPENGARIRARNRARARLPIIHAARGPKLPREANRAAKRPRSRASSVVI
jgi:hypothetical protein